MGRRALQNPNYDFDISWHYREVEDLADPFSADHLFDRAAPLEIEVGSGRGLFMQTASIARPQHNFLGVEITSKYARFTGARLARQEQNNAIMLRGDGLKMFRENLTDGCAKAVHVYFPDPWWKQKHRHRRVLNKPFLQDVVRVLQVGGTLHFWTDVREYYESTLKLIAAVTPLSGPIDVAEKTPEHDFDYRTHFERRMRMHDEPIYRSEFRKP